MDVTDLLKKSTLLGLGFLSLTKKQADKLVRQLQKRTKMSTKEGEKLVKSLLKESKKQGAQLQKSIQKEVDNALRAAGIATQKDLQKLQRSLKKKRKR